MENMGIDLHMHCRASDGTDNVSELLSNVREAGIGTFALTDHDTVAGVMEIEGMIPDDMRFIRGIEFSCITEAGKLHILGYGYDSENAVFKELLNKSAQNRRNKLKKRLSFLKESFGIEFSHEKREELLSANSVGKPHLGNLLVSMGLAGSRNEAIDKYINPCKTRDYRLDGREAINAILKSGGIPVWAHPLGGNREKELSQEEFMRQLDLMLEAGIKGLECYYSKYNEEQVSFLLSAASERKLCVSGGSDYHGKNRDVPLGSLNSYGERIGPENLTIIERLGISDV